MEGSHTNQYEQYSQRGSSSSPVQQADKNLVPRNHTIHHHSRVPTSSYLVTGSHTRFTESLYLYMAAALKLNVGSASHQKQSYRGMLFPAAPS